MEIKVQNAVKSYGSTVILDHFSFLVPSGGTVCLFGPSGCGKSTLLNCIAGLESLDSGKITGTEKKKISYLFQEDRLLPWCTALENISVVLPRHTDPSLARKWLDLVGLDAEWNKYPSQLSGGMRRRVAIARALVYGGDVFLMDEPFQRLDAANKKKAAELIAETTVGKSKILVTHDKREANQLSDIIYILDGIPTRILDKITYIN